MAADVDTAVIALKSAIDAHLAACTARSGEADPRVQEAYDAVRSAAEDYDDVLFDTYGEVTPFEFADVAVPREDDASVPTRVGLYLRRDYDIGDVEELLSAGRVAAVESASQDEGPAITDEVTSVGRAVWELLNANGVDGFDEVAEEAGLELVGGTVWLLDEDPSDDSLFDGPFDAVGADRLLYRLDEVVEG